MPSSATDLELFYLNLDKVIDKYHEQVNLVITATIKAILGREIENHEIPTRCHRQSQNFDGMTVERYYLDGILIVQTEILFNPFSFKIKYLDMKNADGIIKQDLPPPEGKEHE